MRRSSRATPLTAVRFPLDAPQLSLRSGERDVQGPGAVLTRLSIAVVSVAMALAAGLLRYMRPKQSAVGSAWATNWRQSASPIFAEQNAIPPEPEPTRISLRTTGRVRGVTPAELHAFLATPANWPQIVLSSHSVAGSVDEPLRLGNSVDEIFGLPPVLPLSVTWTCARTDASAGLLDVRSDSGLAGVASDCRMLFRVSEDTPDSAADGATVELTMSYVPRSPIAVLAIPALTLDNALALKVLLPAAMNPKPKLDQFRELMGTLYGVAGALHALDLAGPSTLLQLAGAPVFADLPVPGQALAVVWCAAGPVAYLCAKVGGSTADAGLVTYGAVEVLCAALAGASGGGEAQLAALPNAVAVQVVVAACRLSLSRAQR